MTTTAKGVTEAQASAVFDAIRPYVRDFVDFELVRHVLLEALSLPAPGEGEADRINELEGMLAEAEMRESSLRADLSVSSGGLAVKALTVGDLQRAHIERQEEWCPEQKPDLSFRGNEMAGEVGEACNVIKKLERERHGWRGSRATKEQLAEELADVIHTAVLCAITAGIDIETATIAKFDATSEKNGLSTRLSTIDRTTLPAAEGMVLVPREPTREMWAAMADTLYRYKNRHHDKVVSDLWQAMLAAAPKGAL